MSAPRFLDRLTATASACVCAAPSAYLGWVSYDCIRRCVDLQETADFVGMLAGFELFLFYFAFLFHDVPDHVRARYYESTYLAWVFIGATFVIFYLLVLSGRLPLAPVLLFMLVELTARFHTVVIRRDAAAARDLFIRTIPAAVAYFVLFFAMVIANGGRLNSYREILVFAAAYFSMLAVIDYVMVYRQSLRRASAADRDAVTGTGTGGPRPGEAGASAFAVPDEEAFMEEVFPAPADIDDLDGHVRERLAAGEAPAMLYEDLISQGVPPGDLTGAFRRAADLPGAAFADSLREFLAADATGVTMRPAMVLPRRRRKEQRGRGP